MTGDLRFLVRSTMFVALVGAGLFLLMLGASMSPAGDAYRPLIVNLSTIGPGERMALHHGRTDYFILHRTPEQILAVRADDDASMPSPQPDAERVKRAEWLVVEARAIPDQTEPVRFRLIG